MNLAAFTCLLATVLLAAGEPAPPSAKEVIRLLLASHRVKLAVHPTCHGVGSDPKDRDLGDYLAGLLAEYTQGEGQNRLEVLSEPSERPDAWRCTVNLTRRNGEEVWSWGVSFLVRKHDQKVIPGSYRCVGAG